jgi:hypothetical protein
MKLGLIKLSRTFITAGALVLAGPLAGADPPPAAAPQPQQPAADPSDPYGSAFVDPLGFLLFGPTIGVELGHGKISGTVYGRWFSGGLLSQSLFLNSSEKESFDFSYGAGVRGRYYFGGGLSGPHVGAAIEYLHTRVNDPVDLIATNSSYLVPEIEGGYRFPFGAFFVGGAAAVGYAFEIGSSVDNLPGGQNAASFQVVSESKFYASASLDLGVYF